MVAVGLEALFKKLLCNDGGLWESIHAFLNGHKDISIMCNVMEYVEINDVGGYVRQFESHVFWAFHWRVEIKVFDVDGHELGIYHRDNAVEEYFDSDHIGCGLSAVAWEVNAITANC